MANYDTNRINVDSLKQYYSSFSSEKDYYINTTYSTYNSSYLAQDPDSTLSPLFELLSIRYRNLIRAYSNINKWWSSYNETVPALEKELINKISNDNIENSTISDKLSPEYGANVLVACVFDNNYTNLGHWLARTGSPNDMIEYVSNAMDSAIKMGNPLAVFIMKNLYKVEQKMEQDINPNFQFMKLPKDSFYSEGCLAIDESTIEHDNYPTFFHEIMHLLDYLFNGNGPSDYGDRADAYQKAAINNPISCQKIQQFIETSNERYNAYEEKRLIDYNQYVQEIDDMIDATDPDELIDKIYELIGSTAETDELGIKGLDKEEIREILIDETNLYSKDKIYRDYWTTIEGAADIFTSDIISAMVKGFDFEIDGKRNHLTYGHSNDYYTSRNEHIYKEQVADFFALKCLNRQECLDNLKDIYGSDWYNLMEDSCNNVVTGLQNLPG